METEKPVIYIDSECLVCNGFAKFVSRRDDGKFLFGEFSSDRIQSVLSENDVGETIVLEMDDDFYFRSDAVLRIFKGLEKPYSFLYVFRFVPGFLRDFCYGVFRDNRKSLFGSAEKCVLDESLMDRKIEQ